MILNTLHNMKIKYMWFASLIISLMVIPLSTAGASKNTEILAQEQNVRIFFSPAHATLPPNTTLSLMMDAGLYQIGFARIELAFDPSVIQLTGEIQVINSLSTTIEQTSMNEANLTGHIKLILALPPNTPPPTGQFEFAQFPIGVAPDMTSQGGSNIVLWDQYVQIVDINATEVPFVSEVADIIVNPDTTIFADGFESCDLSAWSPNKTDSGDLSASGAAAKVGGCGMQAVIDDNVSIYVTDDSPNADSRYEARFYFDPNSITMASGDSHLIFYAYNGTSKVVLRVEFRRYSSNYQLRGGLLTDGSTWKNSSWLNFCPYQQNCYQQIKFDWRAATSPGSNNGGLTLWVDDVQLADLTGVDNDTWRIDRARLGAVNGIDRGTSGSYYFDEFESRR